MPIVSYPVPPTFPPLHLSLYYFPTDPPYHTTLPTKGASYTTYQTEGAYFSILHIVLSIATIFCTYRLCFYGLFCNVILSNPDPNILVPTFSATIQQDSPLLKTQPQTIVQVDLRGPIHFLTSYYCVIPYWNSPCPNPRIIL